MFGYAGKIETSGLYKDYPLIFILRFPYELCVNGQRLIFIKYLC